MTHGKTLRTEKTKQFSKHACTDCTHTHTQEILHVMYQRQQPAKHYKHLDSFLNAVWPESLLYKCVHKSLTWNSLLLEGSSPHSTFFCVSSPFWNNSAKLRSSACRDNDSAMAMCSSEPHLKMTSPWFHLSCVSVLTITWPCQHTDSAESLVS